MGLRGQETSSFVSDFLDKYGGYAVLNGGFATELERHGADLNDPSGAPNALSVHLCIGTNIQNLEVTSVDKEERDADYHERAAGKEGVVDKNEREVCDHPRDKLCFLYVVYWLYYYTNIYIIHHANHPNQYRLVAADELELVQEMLKHLLMRTDRKDKLPASYLFILL